MRFLAVLTLAICGLTSGVSAANLDVDGLSLTDVNGKQQVLVSKDTKAVVVVFISTTCPVANSFQPALAELHKKFGDQASFLMLHPNQNVTAEMAQQHIEQFSIEIPVCLDSKQEFTKQLNASRTPEAFVLRTDGTIAYQGRINDGFGKPQPSRHELRDAIVSVLAGEEVKVPKTTPVGCPIRKAR